MNFIRDIEGAYLPAVESLVIAGIETLESAIQGTKEELLSISQVGEGTVRLLCREANNRIPELWRPSILRRSVEPVMSHGYYCNLGNSSANSYDSPEICEALHNDPIIDQLVIHIRNMEFVVDLTGTLVQVVFDDKGNALAISFSKDGSGCRIYIKERVT